MKKFLFLLVSVTMVISCTGINRYVNKKNGLLEGKALTKNIIFMIVDGMGFQHVKAARIFNGQKTFGFERFLCKTKVTTCPSDGADNHGICLANTKKVTDSAAAATAIATGFKAMNGEVSQDVGSHTMLKTILEVADGHNKSTGVVVTKLFSDATPAAFISHADRRDDTVEILKDIFKETKPTVIFGADDDLHRGYAEASGLYRMVHNATDLKKVALSLDKGPSCQGSCPRIYGGFGQYSMPGAKKKVGLPLEVLGEKFVEHDVPHLSEMTDAALKILSKNEKGFFLMVESSLPDSISHYNTQMDSDSSSPSAINALVQEMMEVDKTVKVIEEFVASHPSTLLVLTADHETGGLAVLEDQTPCAGQKKCVPKVRWTSEKYELTKESPSRHTAADVPLYAIGRGAKQFCRDRINNIDIPRLAQAE